MWLGIEIGGTKLQLGVGDGRRPEFAELIREEIVASQGAAQIREQIGVAVAGLKQRHSIEGVGIGFGGPVDSECGMVTKSHQVDGWDGFPIREWLSKCIDVPISLSNDCDVAAIAEHRFGAGQGSQSLYYVTVGTGIGGGLIMDRRSMGQGRPSIAEIGHLRPGPQATSPDVTVESFASGWGIRAITLELVRQAVDADSLSAKSSSWRTTLRGLCDIDPAEVDHKQWFDDAHTLESHHRSETGLDAQAIAGEARKGNTIARFAISIAVDVLGWAMAQVANITSPEVIVVGGGVSLMEPTRFLEPLRVAFARYLFGPLQDRVKIEPAQLGEDVVVHGAIALVAGESD